MAKSRFIYKGNERTAEEVEQRSHRASNYDGIILEGFPTWRPKEGENEIRILPVSGGRNWEQDVYQHFDIGVDGGSYLCLDKMKNEPCPICDARQGAVDEDESKALRPSRRRLCWLIDRKNEKAGPQIWNIPDQLFTDINARAIDRKTGRPILIDDPEEGYDIVFMREGTTKTNTKYKGVEVVRDPTPIHDDQRKQEDWLEYVAANPLSSVLCYQDVNYLEKVLRGQVSRRESAEEAEAPRTSRRSVVTEEPAAEAPRRARRTEPEPEAEAPRRAARRADPEPEPETDAPRRASRRAAEPEPEAEQDASNGRAARTERRRPAVEPAEEADLPDQSRAARRGLERLRPSGD